MKIQRTGRKMKDNRDGNNDKGGKRRRNGETGYALKRVLIRGFPSEDPGQGFL